MADNYVTASGSGGNTYASDEDTVPTPNVHHPYVKLEFGVDNTFTKVSDTDPLPIDVKEINSAAVLLDGGVESGALRVTIANDSTGLLTIDHATLDNAHSSDFDSGGGTDTTPSLGIAVAASGGAAVITGDVTNGLDVDVTRVGGTVTVTDDGSFVLAANSGVDVGDVTINNASGASAVNIQDGGNNISVDWAGTVPPIGLGTEAAALRVTLANDSTGLLSVDLDGVQLTASHTRNELFGESLAIGGEFDDTTPVAATEGNVSPLRITVQRAAHINLRDNAGTEVGTSGDPIRVDPTGTTAQPVTKSGTWVLDTNSGVDIGDVDVTDIVPGVGATNLGKAIDSPSAGTDTGVASLAIRDDTLTALIPIDGDYVPLRVNSTGALHVTGGGGGTQFNVDDSAGGTDAGTLALVVRDDALTTLTPIDGDYTQLRVSSVGALHVTGGGGGTEYNEATATPDPIIGTATLFERIDSPGTIAPALNEWAGMICSAEGALWVQDFNSDAILADTTAIQTAVEIIDNAVHTRNEAFGESFAIGGELDDTATIVATEGNVSPLRITAQRAAHINLRNNAGTEVGTSGDPIRIDPTGTTAQPASQSGTWIISANSGVDIGDVTINNASGASAVNIQDGGNSITIDGTVTADAGTGTFVIGGVAAHDAAVSGNPVLLAGEARTTNPTAVADGDVVRLHADDLGRLVTRPHASRDRTVIDRITLTSTTETTLVAAVASVFNDLVMLTLSNESATEVRVDIRDSTGGTIRLSMDLAADGGGAVIPFPVPLPQATVNNNWTAQLSAAVSTVYISSVAIENN